jgi:acetyl-CoA carboxylase carboxyl transferase subunit alpha
MLEHAVYSVISPEGCAAILWNDAAKAPEAAGLMRITAPDLLRFGVIDGIIPEPAGGAHRDFEATAAAVRDVVRDSLAVLSAKPLDVLIDERYEKFRRIGVFEEESRASL